MPMPSTRAAETYAETRERQPARRYHPEGGAMSRFTRREFVRIGAVAGLVAAQPPRNRLAAAEAGETRTGRTISIRARPQPISIDTGKTALIVCDMQNDFAAEGGMFHRAGVDISVIQRAVAPTVRIVAAARKESIPLVYLKMGFRPDLTDAGAPDSPNRIRHQIFEIGKVVRAPNGADSRILIRDTWNTDIVSALAPQSSDVVLYKTRFSGFYETDLQATLERLGVKYLLVTGCTTSVCVESTVRDAMFRDYSCVLLSDCCGEPIGHALARSNHEASLLVVETLFGWVARSDAVLDALAPRSVPNGAGADQT
jgi:ureidoacrylate peracid hydrolase